MSFDHLKSIYRSYDIRGSYPDEINAEEVEKIGRALVDLHDAKTVVVGYDYRPSSEELHEALLRGVTAQGADVISIGLVTTPMLYHASGTTESEVAVMISGSHMPAGFNGLKVCLGNAVPIGLESGLAELRNYVAANNFNATTKTGTISELNIEPVWHEHVAKHISLDESKSLSVVVDPANMIGIKEIDTIAQFPNLTVTSIFDTYDWSCPNHEANPIKLDTLADLGKKVVETGADLGIGLDGDADRIGIVDETGTPVPQDMVGILIARELLQRNGNTGNVIYDVRSSKRVIEVVEEHGGKAIPWRIGHTHLRRKMAEVDGLYALELSGHHFFREMHNSEGGIYPAILLLQIVQQAGKPLSELVAAEQIYFHSTEINSEVLRTPEAIYENLQRSFPDGEFETIDGLTIKYDDWWCNVRPSANDPVMRMNLEADTKELMEKMRDQVLAVIRD